MELNKFYEKVGGNYELVLKRLPSAQMITKFVCKFADDPSYRFLEEALAAGDTEAAFRAAHTLKGTAANLGLDDLANAASELTEALRNAEPILDETLVLAVEEAYQTVMEQITELRAALQR